MPIAQTYYAKRAQERTEKLRQLLTELPKSCEVYFRGIEPTTSPLTRLSYAYDLRLFFHYLTSGAVPEFSGKTPQEMDYSDLNRITALMLERFLEYLSYYQSDGKEYINDNAGKARKISTLKSFFKYLYRKELIAENVAERVEMPKLHEKPIIRLEPDEVARMLDAVDSGAILTKTQQRYHKYTRTRDIAIFTLLLGTGIRISELVGLDVNSIDFRVNSFIVTRKGGAQVQLYFGEEVEHALANYMEEREKIIPQPGSEQALFLSLQKKRMSQRAIQQLVKKYAQVITPLKKISPHKFRSTFGTMLNYETGDIYLVADVLGNKDVNTTRKHYAALSDDRRRQAATKIRLRDEDSQN